MRESIIQIGRDSAWYLASNILVAITAFASIPILTRLFTPGEYGIFSLVNTFVALVSPMLFTYLTSSMMRYYPEYEQKNELDVFYSTSLHYVPHFTLLLLGVGLPLAAFVLPLGEYRLLICLAIVVFVLFTEFNILLYGLRIVQMSWQYALFHWLVQFFRYIVGAGVVYWFGTGVEGPFWAWMGILIILIPIEVILLGVWKYFRWSKNSLMLQKAFLFFGLPLVLQTFLSQLLTAADRFLVQGFKGPYQVGLYSVVYTLVLSVEQIMVTFIVLGALPVVVRVYEAEGENKAVRLMRWVTRYFLVMLMPTVLGLWVLRQPILQVISTPKYAPAQAAFVPLVLGIFLSNIAWIPYVTFYLHKKTKLTLIPTGLAVAFNVGLNMFMIPRYGYLGAAWATLISYAVYFIVMTVMALRLMRWDFPWISAVRTFASAAAMAAVMFFMKRAGFQGFWGLLAMLAAGGLTYIAFLLVSREISRAEIEFFFSVLARLPLVGPLFSRFTGGTGEEDRNEREVH